MRAFATSEAVLVGLCAGLASAYGCSSSGSNVGAFTGPAGWTSGAGGGTAGAAGQATVGASGAGGDGSTAGASDPADGGSTAGASGSDGGAVGAVGSTDGGTAYDVGSSTVSIFGNGRVSGAGPINRIVASAGCGMDPTQTPGMAVLGTIQTMGTKAPDCADTKCGPWSYLREFFVTLPVGYDKTRAYPLIFQMPGCGGRGLNTYPLIDNGVSNVGNTVIRVGLTPPPNDIGHATNPGQGCFDESEGDDSVDFVFYENLYDQLASQICFDRNRVFTNGNASGGGRFSDELACKYAGDAQRPIRGVISNSGDWTTNPAFLPTCTTHPMAGMWVHETNDPVRPWTSDKLAVARAMMVDGCTIGTGFDDAALENFPIGGGNADSVCQRIDSCSELTPLVVCLIPGNQHAGHDNIVNPGASTFLKLFESPPLLSK